MVRALDFVLAIRVKAMAGITALCSVTLTVPLSTQVSVNGYSPTNQYSPPDAWGLDRIVRIIENIKVNTECICKP